MVSLSEWIAADPPPVGRSAGVEVIVRKGRGRGIGRPTYFRSRSRSGGQPATTTWCFTAHRVAAARLETPIFV